MCNCGKAATSSNDTQPYVVTFPDGTKKVVNSEHAAKVEVTMKGGGTYSRV